MTIAINGMTFKKEFRNFSPCFISENGKYKISIYGNHFHAYFLPKGWDKFGNAVRLDRGISKRYNSLKAAMEDCVAHFKMYPHGANEIQRLVGIERK